MSSVENDTPELAEYYDRISDIQYELGLTLIDLMNIKPDAAVLDVGCGTGRLAFHVSGIVGPKGRVTGIDPSPHRVQVAEDRLKANAIGNVRFSVSQAEALTGFDDNTFEDLYYCAVFHWIGDRQAALKEAFRVLKPGGTVGITSRNRGTGSIRKAIISEWLEKHPEYKRHYRPGGNSQRAKWASQEELAQLLKNAGFTDIRFESRPRTYYFASAREYFAFLKASAFGQQSSLPEGVRQKIRAKVAAELEKRRTSQGIELRTSSLLAIAKKLA